MEQQFVDRRASLLANKIARTNLFMQRQNIQKVPVTFAGEQLDFIRLAMVDGINEDALRTIDKPKIEIHLSNIYNREEYRKKSITSEGVDGLICGFGGESYILAIEAIYKLIYKK